MTDLIKRCPFCGSSALPMRGPEGWAVHCNADGTLGADETKCGAVGPVRISEDHAVTAWNARLASQPASEGLRERIEQVIDQSLGVGLIDARAMAAQRSNIIAGVLAALQPLTEPQRLGQEGE